MRTRHEKILFTDRLLAATVLPAIPRSVRPNLVTLTRVVAVPFVAFLFYIGEYLTGGILFAVFAFSDAVDGALARTRGQITEWGKIWDPIADKLLVGIAGVILIVRHVSVTLAGVIVVIELALITSGAYRKYVRGIDVKAEWAGKIKMVLQSAGVGLLALYLVTGAGEVLTIAIGALYGAVALALVSFFVYKGV